MPIPLLKPEAAAQKIVELMTRLLIPALREMAGKRVAQLDNG
jgi:hypothetical protein